MTLNFLKINSTTDCSNGSIQGQNKCPGREENVYLQLKCVYLSRLRTQVNWSSFPIFTAQMSLQPEPITINSQVNRWSRPGRILLLRPPVYGPAHPEPCGPPRAGGDALRTPRRNSQRRGSAHRGSALLVAAQDARPRRNTALKAMSR